MNAEYARRLQSATASLNHYVAETWKAASCLESPASSAQADPVDLSQQQE